MMKLLMRTSAAHVNHASHTLTVAIDVAPKVGKRRSFLERPLRRNRHANASRVSGVEPVSHAVD
ncbi:hypothetical protein, partial [Pandoraea nosoerga]|uniref:hypothetical protein n=1 Tax=Pandoraea nosoerga TaxID=2508296 RepID=UPI001980C1BF